MRGRACERALLMRMRESRLPSARFVHAGDCVNGTQCLALSVANFTRKRSKN